MSILGMKSSVERLVARVAGPCLIGLGDDPGIPTNLVS